MATYPVATLLAVLVLGQGTAQAQKPKEPPVDPAVPKRLAELKSYVKDRKMENDFQAIGLIQALTKEPDKQNSKDKGKIAKGLGDVFKFGKVREGRQDVIYREAADALAKYEEDGAKQLAKYAEHKRFDDNLSLRAHMLRALGKTKDDKQIDYLLEVTSRSPHDELRAAAGEALGNFTEAKIKDKREIVKEIIRAWGSQHSEATRAANLDPNGPVDFGPQNARRILRACEGKWVATLQKLTGMSHTKFPDWQRWLNKNKNWES
ncbi:MAG: HEAT repeat domain-containing protein [Planctomycetes bacterium]|nr:HEAT repeat domain-containing protein [Planctomycetota bacterium]